MSITRIFNFIARRWLERHGYYVVRPGAVEMVLSGHFTAIQDATGSYLVFPPHPNAFVVALNHSLIRVNSLARFPHQSGVDYELVELKNGNIAPIAVSSERHL